MRSTATDTSLCIPNLIGPTLSPIHHPYETSLFSISYAGLWGQDRLELEDFLHHAAQLGFTNVMIAGKRPHLSPLDTTQDQLELLRRVLELTGLHRLILGAYTDFAGGQAGEVPYVEMQIHYVELLAECSATGANIIRVFTSYESSTLPFATLWERTVKAIRECCDRAAKFSASVWQSRTITILQFIAMCCWNFSTTSIVPTVNLALMPVAGAAPR